MFSLSVKAIPISRLLSAAQRIPWSLRQLGQCLICNKSTQKNGPLAKTLGCKANRNLDSEFNVVCTSSCFWVQGHSVLFRRSHLPILRPLLSPGKLILSQNDYSNNRMLESKGITEIIFWVNLITSKKTQLVNQNLSFHYGSLASSHLINSPTSHHSLSFFPFAYSLSGPPSIVPSYCCYLGLSSHISSSPESCIPLLADLLV